MSCGCGHKHRESGTVSVRRGRMSPLSHIQQTLRARAAACHLCPHGTRDPKSPWDRGVVQCSISGKPAFKHIGSNIPCPRDRFPDEHGFVTRYGFRWYGVPFPDRLILWFHNRRPAVCSAYDGCGCIVRLKNLTSRIPFLRRLSICKAHA